MRTISHQNTGPLVLVAKLLTGYIKVGEKVTDVQSYIKVNGVFDADFVSFVCTWQSNHGLTADGIIGPKTWAEIAKSAPTCSTAKNRISGYTLALQLLLGGNLTADGIYGARTKAAVAVYQDAQHLTADGICGPKTWTALIVGVTASETPVTATGFVQPVDYKQYDSRWKSKMYSATGNKNQTMSNSGCGPTAAADVIATLKNQFVTPWTLAQLAMKWGDRTKDSGTAWSFFKRVAEHYGIQKFVQSSSWPALTACLDAGGYAVCSMGAGYWTKGGHYICVWKYDGKYVYANDPASSTRKKQAIGDFKNQRKQYFCFYPDATPVKREPEPTGKRGSKIVDVSKYQPTIDYDAFIADTALIILRAGYRGTGGGINEDQSFQQHADALKQRGVRFGVYFFSIAKTEDMAREEARMFYKYAKDYDPLFWAMDAEEESIPQAAIIAFVDELRKLGAGRVGCYVASYVYQHYDYAAIAGKMDFTWLGYFGSKRVYTCDMWQYTGKGAVDGISGNVDLSKITGEGHSLAWFCGGE